MDMDPEQTAELAQALSAGRTRAGSPSWSRIERQLIVRLGDDVPSAESLRRLHLGEVPVTSANVILVVALMAVYGMHDGELPPIMRARINRARELLSSHSGCFSYTPDGPLPRPLSVANSRPKRGAQARTSPPKKNPSSAKSSQSHRRIATRDRLLALTNT